VDFDPVKVKARGGDPVAELGLATEIAALFPDSFQDTTLGPIPTGWELGETNDLCKLNRQQVNPGAHPSEVYYHYSLPAFDESCRPKEELGAAIKSNKFGLESPSLLVSKLNPHIPRIWFVPNPVVGRSVASTEFLVLTPTTRTNLPYLYAKFSDPEFMRHLEELITGTSNSHRRVQPDVFMAQTEVLPPERVAAAYEAVAAPLLAQVEASRAQSRSLAEARDFLLPRLLSGSFRMEVA